MASTVKVVTEPEAPCAKRRVEVAPEKFAKGVELAKRAKCDGIRVVPESANIRRPIELELDLLAEVPHLKVLSVSPYVMMAKKQNVDGLYALRSLKSLSFHHRDAPVDFARLATLEELAYTFSPNATGFDA
jgi:hypothetical protein